MTARWYDIPQDWLALQRGLRRTVGEINTDAKVSVVPVSATGAIEVTAPTTLLPVDTTGGSVTVTLPAASACAGCMVMVKKLVAANTVTVDGSTFDGASSVALTSQYQSVTLLSDGTVYHVV